MNLSVPARLRTESRVFARAGSSVPTDDLVRKRLGWIWGMLFLNVLAYTKAPVLLPIPSIVGKLVTQGALLVAIGLALTLNRRKIVRPNGFLLIFSVLSVLTLVVSVHGYFGVGSIVRAARFAGFIFVLWLLTPWWGRRDLLLVRFHRRALLVIMTSVFVGMLLVPGKAFAQAGGGRLGGAIWAITPTQVAHYSAVFAGLTIVMWFSGLLAPRTAALAAAIGVSAVILTHTRTALIGLMVGILVAGLSLFFSRKRVRRAFLVTFLVALLIVLSFAPFVSRWFTRGENLHQLGNLTGRTAVWTALVHQPRGEVATLFGYGMSNDSFNGLPIDSSWLSIYQAQGLVGDVIVAVALVLLLLIALMAPRGPNRAIALFLIVYCMIASYTETGLGNASPYLLDLAITMSLLMPSIAMSFSRSGQDGTRHLLPVSR